MLISNAQTGFVHGRLLPENFNSARELIYEISKQKEPAFLLKIDFKKAFDSIAWKFLFHILECRGFPSGYISWIKTLFQSATSSIVLNDHVGPAFSHKKGLRQGDPLSPFLFLLAGDVLCKMLEAAALNIREGITAKLKEPFHILQYADDTLIFSTAKGTAPASLHCVLQTFSAISGITINDGKSAIIPFNLTQQESDSIQATFNCNLSNLPLIYLGLPLTKGRPDRAAYQALIDRIHCKLQAWKGSLMSRAGRIVLASAVLSSIPVFYMSVFKFPMWVIRDIDRIRRNFIWGKGITGTSGIPLLSWDRVCLPKAYGGLGLINLRLQNISLLLRWWWRIYDAPDSQWACIVKLLYGKRDVNVPPIGWNQRGSFFWQDLQALRLYFQLSTYTEIQSGRQNLFWFDQWGDKRLYHFGSEPSHLPKKFISLVNAMPILAHLLPAPLTRDQTELLHTASNMLFTPNKDSLKWRWTSNGKYSAASVYRALITAGKLKFPLKRIWSIKVTPSVKCFLLLLVHNRILTQEQLLRRNISVVEKCVMCDQNIRETASHLFLSCALSNALWIKLSHTIGTSLVYQTSNCSQALIHMLSLTTDSKFKEAIIATTFWGLWLERNNRVFRQESRPMSVIHDWIIGEATFFMKYC
ncbi:hypothetical protein LUZ63_000791 [Rhynchospora breviuscula]|uniref:Reverse transcriptase domain-containing protein n=1 Tax=Rhynchospora breviuscula TaxID=2022672 RepID=A0A9Q0CVP0_9POAL|nr:hypothetical protein LUZ63_000791 [Rhynchospora breviuscula]